MTGDRTTGFTLLEALIAMVVLAVTVITAVAIAGSTLGISASTSVARQATRLAENEFEMQAIVRTVDQGASGTTDACDDAGDGDDPPADEDDDDRDDDDRDDDRDDDEDDDDRDDDRDEDEDDDRDEDDEDEGKGKGKGKGNDKDDGDDDDRWGPPWRWSSAPTPTGEALALISDTREDDCSTGDPATTETPGTTACLTGDAMPNGYTCEVQVALCEWDGTGVSCLDGADGSAGTLVTVRVDGPRDATFEHERWFR